MSKFANRPDLALGQIGGSVLFSTGSGSMNIFVGFVLKFCSLSDVSRMNASKMTLPARMSGLSFRKRR